MPKMATTVNTSGRRVAGRTGGERDRGERGAMPARAAIESDGADVSCFSAMAAEQRDSPPKRREQVSGCAEEIAFERMTRSFPRMPDGAVSVLGMWTRRAWRNQDVTEDDGEANSPGGHDANRVDSVEEAASTATRDDRGLPHVRCGHPCGTSPVSRRRPGATRCGGDERASDANTITSRSSLTAVGFEAARRRAMEPHSRGAPR